ncbi:MAG: hypothetical protein ACK5MT_11880 [Actinomycetales bacterium]
MQTIGYVARCTVERLMREFGLVGVRRGVVKKDHDPDSDHARAADLVRRRLTPTARTGCG